MLTPEQEYYARVCERDALWNEYCHCPTDKTWARYVEACESVKAAEQLRPADTLPECEIARSCYFGEGGKCLRGGECR